ncbi:methionine--tRNA ligase, partial [Patescibacteria group bacterium]|nr:methionine--tRNA ligase [Patescibacteria group bacterium]
ALNLSYNNFIRTTDPYHKKAAQEFWKLCAQNGDIYKKDYKTKYCVGCELEKTDSELTDGKCPDHPTTKIEIIEEENYFFKFSKYQKPLLELYKKNPKFVIPDFRQKEIENFVKEGLRDFSVSRLKTKMPWGVEVPGDPEHVMYVWFDALVNYISAIGWPDDIKHFKNWWPVVQFAGKDNLRQQSAIWQAMLMSAGIAPSKQILIHDFISSGGQKMSKSLGNVIDPYELVEKYGTDALRYFLLAKIHPFKESDFTIERFEKTYQADLANGLGNLVSRVAGLVKKSMVNGQWSMVNTFSKEVEEAIGGYEFNEALAQIWSEIKDADVLINKREVWKLKGKELEIVLNDLVGRIRQIAFDLKPFLPETSQKIAKAFQITKLLVKQPDYKDSWTNIKLGTKINLDKPLFPRLK